MSPSDSIVIAGHVTPLKDNTGKETEENRQEDVGMKTSLIVT